MEQFKIHLPLSSYINNNFGQFCVQLDDYYFPSKDWTDFGERVVFSWRDKLSEFLLEEDKKAICKFMDGNYRLDVEPTNDKNIFKISFIRDAGDLDEIKYQGNVNSEQFLGEILRIIKSIQEECRKNDNHEAVERIETSIQKFLTAKDNFLK